MKSQDFLQIVADSLSLPRTQIQFAHAASSSPGYGFDDIANWEARSPGPNLWGIIACTEPTVAFGVWNESQGGYLVAWKYGYDQIKSIEVKTFGLSRRIVIEFAESGFVTFSTVNFDGGVDRGATEEAERCIRDNLNQHRDADAQQR